jgi:hypothetical protein
MHYMRTRITHSSNVNVLSKHNFQIVTISFDDYDAEAEAYIILIRGADYLIRRFCRANFMLISGTSLLGKFT